MLSQFANCRFVLWNVALFVTLLLVSCEKGSLGNSVSAQQEPEKPEIETAPESTDQSFPVSRAHSLFSSQCNLCHIAHRSFRDPSDAELLEARCKACHAGPDHNTVQISRPGCVSCHTEHKGEERLARVANDNCTKKCHSNLQTKNNVSSKFASQITGFSEDHPQFAITIGSDQEQKRLRLDGSGTRQLDPAQIKFPHDKHLKPALKTATKGLVQLECKSCHVPAIDGLRMTPITYQKQCQQCHPLAFDQCPTCEAPHGSPQSVRAYLLLSYAERKRDSVPPSPTTSGRITRSVPSVVPPDVNSSVAQQAARAEQNLYDGACKKCHVVTDGAGKSLPKVAPTAIPSAWLPYARFAHKPHRMLECAACHKGVEKSGKATDVLLPGIQVCRECHHATEQKDAVQTKHSASTDCVSCHLYHDKSTDVQWNGPFTVEQVLTEGKPK